MLPNHENPVRVAFNLVQHNRLISTRGINEQKRFFVFLVRQFHSVFHMFVIDDHWERNYRESAQKTYITAASISCYFRLGIWVRNSVSVWINGINDDGLMWEDIV